MGDNHNMNQQAIQEMQRQLNELTAALTQAQAAGRPKPKAVMGEVKPYNNTDRGLYPQFEAKLRAKLYVDRNAIGGPFERLWVAFGYLEEDASKKLYPWMETYATDVTKVTEETIEQFFSQMQFYFADGHIRSKAMQQLQQLRQYNKPFNEYLGEFERLVLEAGGATWQETMKSEMLLNGMNLELQRALASLPPPNTFVEFTRQAQRTADRLEAVGRAERAHQKRKNPRVGRTPTPLPPQVAAPEPANNDTMDWTSTTVHKVKQRAKWVTPEEIEKRKADPDRCLRCGGSGHRVKDCPYLPARPPKVQAKSTKAVAMHTPEVCKDEESETDESSKNE
jgi:hypothetical protein